MESHIEAKSGYLVSRMYGTFCLGNVVQGSVSINDAVGAISELMSAGEVVKRMASDAKVIMNRLNNIGF